MNAIFFALIFIAFAVAGYRELTWLGPAGGPEGGPEAGASSPMEVLTLAVVDSASGAVSLAIGLVGMMALFLGLMKVAEAGGLLAIIARVVRPLMVRLFPEVPADHPAMGAMILNISANVLGLGNAATPFGIRAMQELDKLNGEKGTATNAMALFLAINTSSVTLLPTGIIALRAAAGSNDPAAILPTTLFATVVSTTVAILAAKLYQRLSAAPAPAPAPAPSSGGAAETGEAGEAMEPAASEAYPAWVSWLTLLCVAAIVPLAILYGRVISPWIVPGLVVALLGFGMLRGVRVYEVFVEGAKDGFQVALRIIPYLVAILVAVGMFRGSGAMELLLGPLGAVTSAFGLPPEALSMALLRPLSGSGAYGLVAATLESAGPDSYTGYLVSTLQGSTETTFYVLAVYFGAVQVRRVRHALITGLTADLAGVIAAVVICSLLFVG